jgi:hypothetical protein
MSFYKLTPIAVMTVLCSACQQAVDNELLLFQDSEQGIQPYQTRVIVTPTQVRFDDGKGSKSYTLFDRKSRIARTVDIEQRTILEMHPKSVKVKPPFALNYTVKDLGEMKNAPKIMGKTPKHFQEYTNNKLCFDVITVDGLMPQALQALSEFRQLLASDSVVTFNNIPADMQEPCSMAMSTFAPTRYLQHGFPIHQWYPGFSRILIDYKEHYQPDPKLFEIPDGYFTYTVKQVREGVVDLDNRKIRTLPTAQKE